MLLQELEHAMRKTSSQGAMFAKIVAERAGISSADMECIDFVNVEGRMTAGRRFLYALAVPVGTVRSRLSRARTLLRENWSAAEEEQVARPEGGPQVAGVDEGPVREPDRHLGAASAPPTREVERGRPRRPHPQGRRP